MADEAIFLLPVLTVSATGITSVKGTATFSLPVVLLAGDDRTGTAAFDLPLLTLAASGEMGVVATAEFLLPSLTLISAGTAGPVGQAAFNLPLLTLVAGGELENRITLPLLTLVASGDAGLVGSSTPRLPVLSLDAAGMVNHVGNAAFNLPLVSLSATGVIGRLGNAAFSLPVLRLSATGVLGNVGTAAFDLPIITLAGAGSHSVLGTAVFNLPALLLAARGSPALAAVYQTIVLNTRKGPITTYDWQFNSYAFFNGLVLAAGDAGVVVLGTQDADDDQAIDMRVRVGKSDLGDSHLKRVPRIHTGIKATGDVLFRTITSETGTRTYRLPYNHVEGYTQRRVPVGKGPKSRFWQFEWANEDGSDVSIKDLLILPNGLRRREQ